MKMATTTHMNIAPWDWLAVEILQRLQYDDIIAVTAVLLASVAYVTNGTAWNRPDAFQSKLYERAVLPDSASDSIKHSRCLAERLQQVNADVAILWASQSGTGERFAVRLAKELTQLLGVRVLLLDVSDIDPASCGMIPASKQVIFIASTFGEGDPSDNMHTFWEWLHQSSSTTLSDLRFMAFGLGNSNYKHYNHVIDVLVENLLARNAQSLMATGRADDATGTTEEDFLAWKEAVLEFFEASLGYQRREMSYEPSIQITEADLDATNTNQKRPKIAGLPKVCSLPIIQSRELFKDSTSRNCLHIELDLVQHPELKYKTGDYLSVWPTNPIAEVECLLLALGLESHRERSVLITSLDDTPVKVPSRTTIQAMFESSLEVCSPLSRDHVASLAAFAPNDTSRQFLHELGTDKKAYAAYLNSHYTNLGRLLRAACNEPGAWSKLPLSLVVEILPAMQPRSYSISSSSVVQARQVAITAVVADKELSDSRERIPGLTTNHLMHAANGTHPRGMRYSIPARTLLATIHKSTFKLPITSSAPLVMVGAGTGVAPFRAFVQERARLADMGRDVGTMKLFFGCRHPDEDSLYAEEFAAFEKKLGSAFGLIRAFSRPTDGSSKQYVQHAIADQAEETLDLLLNSNAHFYICGSAAMARDVSDTVAKLIMARTGWSEGEMKEFADRQKAQKRWLQDVWG